ncbi:hypothetical protein [Ureibacillus endophyticus]|uniref:DUF4901 domain-containing protein n=1 Tax=Ureibacillus endophyticus TaxID=1978490 RepID=A0A494Z7B9_9BACL|nr:hypothetical protein [Lysinibacillus endophyticus]RKQ18400.1 hypothetical protein D8M03_05990 [Lysinibacillus endophyticus]
MDTRVQELVEYTINKFGLNQYYLQNYYFNRTVNSFNETVYTLGMEFFPNHAEKDDDDSNPDGTACIEINIENRKFTSVIFVMGKSYTENGFVFNGEMEEIIEWVENETGLTYGKHFQIHKEEKGEVYFKACINSISVSPSGWINIKFNEEGKLTLFSVFGEFPSIEVAEEFSLNLDKIDHLKKEQIKLINFPSYEEKKLYSIYAVEEIYITNDGTRTIPFEIFKDEKVDHIIYWEEPLNKSFERKYINWMGEISAEQAFASEPSPDIFPITELEQEKCISAVRDFLRQEYPNDSGKWVLKSLSREKGYIHATLKANSQDNYVFQRKMKVWIDPEHFKVDNYMDNDVMLETFNEFQPSDKGTITKEDAYEMLEEYFELIPTFVYDEKQQQYVLCGKLDCRYSVNAASGEVVSLDEI